MRQRGVAPDKPIEPQPQCPVAAAAARSPGRGAFGALAVGRVRARRSSTSAADARSSPTNPRTAVAMVGQCRRSASLASAISTTEYRRFPPRASESASENVSDHANLPPDAAGRVSRAADPAEPAVSVTQAPCPAVAVAVHAGRVILKAARVTPVAG